MTYKDKNLLIISLWYPSEDWKYPIYTFIKDQVDYLKNYFNKVFVVCPTPFIPKFIAKSKYISYYFKEKAFRDDYKYDNVEVFFPRFLTAPIKFFQKNNWHLSYNAVLKCINNNYLHFDLIHAHFLWPCWYVWVKIKDKFWKKCICTWHWFDVYKLPFQSENIMNIYKMFLKDIDRIITVSWNNKECIKKLWNNNCDVIYNWYNSDIFYLKEYVSLDNPKYYNMKKIITVWALKEIKNHRVLIEALYMYKQINSGFVCFIIWDWSEKKNLQKMINDYWLNNNIILVWSIPHNQIIDWLNSSDLFVLPSKFEWNPTVMFESLACWLPYVWSNVWWVSEIVINDNLWYLYNDVNNYKELSKLIHKALLKQWDKKYISSYWKKFSTKNMISEILNIYKEYLK